MHTSFGPIHDTIDIIDYVVYNIYDDTLAVSCICMHACMRTRTCILTQFGLPQLHAQA